MARATDRWRHALSLIKLTMKKCIDSRNDMHIALLQIRTTPMGQGLHCPATLLFNGPVRGIMPVINRLPIGTNNDEHHKALVDRQCKTNQDKDTSKNLVSLPIRVYCSGSTRRQGTMDLWINSG